MPNIRDSFVSLVGYHIVRVSQRPTITAGLYGDGDALGGRLEFGNATRFPNGSGIVLSASIIDLAAQNAGIDLILFNQSFIADVDNAVFDPTDAAHQNLVGVIKFAADETGDWVSFNDSSIATKANLWLPFTTVGTQILYGHLRINDATPPTYAATNDITVTLHILQS